LGRKRGERVYKREKFGGNAIEPKDLSAMERGGGRKGRPVVRGGKRIKKFTVDLDLRTLVILITVEGVQETAAVGASL